MSGVARAVRRPETWLLTLIAIVSVYLWWMRLPFPGTDDLVYKQPGEQLARGLAFAAPGLTGYHEGMERVFAHYPPLFPALHGLWFALFGFSWPASLALGLLIVGLLASALARCVRLLAGRPVALAEAAVVFACWTVFVREMHRPDPLAVLFALLLLGHLAASRGRTTGPGDHVVAALLCALTLSTSLVLGAVLLCGVAVTTLHVRGPRGSAGMIVSGGAGGLALCAAAWWFAIRSEPGLVLAQYFDRFGEFTDRGLIDSLTQGLRFGLTYGHSAWLAPIVGALVVSALARTRGDSAARRVVLWQVLGLSLLLVAMLVKITEKYTYQQALLPLLAIACLGTTTRPSVSRSARLANAAVVLGALAAIVPTARIAALPLSWDAADRYEPNVRRLRAAIPPGSSVVTDVRLWYALAEGRQVFDAYFAPANVMVSDFVVLASGGGGAPDRAPVPMEGHAREVFDQDFVLAESTLSDEPNAVAGIPLARSRWSWRYEIHRRRAPR